MNEEFGILKMCDVKRAFGVSVENVDSRMEKQAKLTIIN